MLEREIILTMRTVGSVQKPSTVYWNNTWMSDFLKNWERFAYYKDWYSLNEDLGSFDSIQAHRKA